MLSVDCLDFYSCLSRLFWAIDRFCLSIEGCPTFSSLWVVYLFSRRLNSLDRPAMSKGNDGNFNNGFLNTDENQSIAEQDGVVDSQEVNPPVSPLDDLPASQTEDVATNTPATLPQAPIDDAASEDDDDFIQPYSMEILSDGTVNQLDGSSDGVSPMIGILIQAVSQVVAQPSNEGNGNDDQAAAIARAKAKAKARLLQRSRNYQRHAKHINKGHRK